MADDGHQRHGLNHHETLPGDESSLITTRGLEMFGRKVTATANQLINPAGANAPYQSAVEEMHKQLKRPAAQNRLFSMARTSPRDIVRSSLSTTEMSHRALTYLPDELLINIPGAKNDYSLFQGFKASLPTPTKDGKAGPLKHRRRGSRGRKLLVGGQESQDIRAPDRLHQLEKEKAGVLHELEMLSIRKYMASAEITDIDNKIANLHGIRKHVFDRLAKLEQEENIMEHDVIEVENQIQDAQEAQDDEQQELLRGANEAEDYGAPSEGAESGFMSQSIYEKLPSAVTSPGRAKRPKAMRRRSMPVLHEHFDSGSLLREIRAHSDAVTALDFDAPFGTLVTSGMDDSLRVWDLNAGRCIGLLEGHTASVRTLQVQDNILATGSADATIRLWDLSRAHYDPQGTGFGQRGRDEDEDAIAFQDSDDQPVEPPPGSTDDCHIFTLQAHVGEVTALHFSGDTLVSGSSDKTLRQWDLERGRCVQTLDVMWAAAQAVSQAGRPGSSVGWRATGRSAPVEANFVGAVQVFDAALACGTADGWVRLWDLRSGQMHRSLIGHTGPVTSLQFDAVHIVTASIDRSIRIWDLRTGSISDAYAYEHPVTSMMFDARRIASAAGEDVVKVYDKIEGRQWDCGAGAAGGDGRPGHDAHTGGDGAVSGLAAVVGCVRLRDGYLVEGRRNGVIGAWSC